MGWGGSRQGTSGSHLCPYVNRTPIQVSRVIRRGSLGPLRPDRVQSGLRRNPDWARHAPTSHDGAFDFFGVQMMYRLNSSGPEGVPTGPPGPYRDTTAAQRYPFHRTPLVWAAHHACRRKPGLLVITSSRGWRPTGTVGNAIIFLLRFLMAGTDNSDNKQLGVFCYDSTRKELAGNKLHSCSHRLTSLAIGSCVARW